MTRLRHTKRKKEKTKKPTTEKRVQQTDYGPVVVVHDCKYKGRVGYYDDDDDDDPNRAIVYFGTPFQSGYVIIPRSWLRKTAVTPLALEKWKRENPELAKQCGVP
jgi:hypothetical protein